MGNVSLPGSTHAVLWRKGKTIEQEWRGADATVSLADHVGAACRCVLCLCT